MALLLFSPWVPLHAQALPAEEIVARTQQVLFYPGNDMKASLRMRLVSKEGSERLRELTMLREETLNGRPVFVIRSVPKDERSVDFSYRLAWIDKENFVLWREEYYDKRNELYKVFTADEVKQVEGQWTTLRRTMKNLQNGHRSEVTYVEVSYNVGLEDSLFSERYLRNPPARRI